MTEKSLADLVKGLPERRAKEILRALGKTYRTGYEQGRKWEKLNKERIEK